MTTQSRPPLLLEEKSGLPGEGGRPLRQFTLGGLGSLNWPVDLGRAGAQTFLGHPAPIDPFIMV